MKEMLKAYFILSAGIFLSAFPYLPVQANPTQTIQSVLRKKANAGGGGGVPTPDHLWWKLDEGTLTSITDYSSGGTGDGTLSGAAWNGTGVGGGDSLDFNGTSDFADTDAAVDMTGSTIITISFWLKPDDLTGTEVIVESGPSVFANDNGYVVYLTGSNIRCAMNDQQGADHDQYWAYGGSAGEWSHHLFVFNHTASGNVDYYYNGSDQGAGTTVVTGDNAGSFSNQLVNVGSRNSGGSLYLAGSIDDIRIWDGDQSAYATDIYDEGFVVVEENTSAITDNRDISDTANTYYLGVSQYDPGSGTPGATIVVRAVEFALDKEGGDISGKTYTCYIYDDSGGALNTLLGTSNGITGDNAWSDTWVKFDFPAGVTLSSGTNYNIVLSAGSVDATNYAVINVTASGGLAGVTGNWDSGGTRQSFTSLDSKVRLYE